MGTTLVIEALSLNYNKAFGFQEFLFNILNYFKKYREKIIVDKIIIACKYVDKQAFIPFEPEMEIYSFKIYDTLHKYYILNTLYSKLHLKKNDIILFTNNYSALFKFCKYILVIHDLLYLRPHYIPNKFFRLQRRLFVPRSIRIADKIISISKWVKKDILYHFKHIDSDKIIPIYNNLNFSKFEKGIPSSSIIQLCKNKKFFLIICANAHHKNTITTLKAYKKYVCEGGDYDLFFIGSFSPFLLHYYDSLEEKIKSKIHNLQSISNTDLGYLYKQAKAYC